MALAFASGSGGGGGGGVQSVSAGDSSIDVAGTAANPTVAVAASGVSAGTYGDGSHVSQVTVDADGRVTAAADVALAAGMVTLFDQTLAVDAASIDTGATGIAGGYVDLLIYASLRTADAGSNANILVTFNADSTVANYLTMRTQVANISQTLAVNTGTIAGTFAVVAAAGSDPSAFGFLEMLIPGYTSGAYKTGRLQSAVLSTTATGMIRNENVFSWRSTAAINRLTCAPQTGANLKAGSQLTIYGTAS